MMGVGCGDTATDEFKSGRAGEVAVEGMAEAATEPTALAGAVLVADEVVMAGGADESLGRRQRCVREAVVEGGADDVDDDDEDEKVGGAADDAGAVVVDAPTPIPTPAPLVSTDRRRVPWSSVCLGCSNRLARLVVLACSAAGSTCGVAR